MIPLDQAKNILFYEKSREVIKENPDTFSDRCM